jgi:hypothetical protein
MTAALSLFAEPEAQQDPRPACFSCGTRTNLVLIVSDGRAVERKPCCFNVQRGCDSAADAFIVSEELTRRR